MHFTDPVSTIMSHKLITVSPHDDLTSVQDLFNLNRIHHILVVRHKTLVGIISKLDFIHFVRSNFGAQKGNFPHDAQLRNYTAEDIMTTGIATLETTDRINVAIQIFTENMFHALPVLQEDEVAGILTTHDIIRVLADEDNRRIRHQN